MFSYAANPWQRIFNQSHGAHIWLHTRAGAADVDALGRLDGVAALSGPYRTAATTVESRGARAGVTLRATSAQPPETGRPLLTAGSWLTAADSGPHGGDGTVVLETSVARALWAEPGETVRVTGPDGTARELRVAGIAEAAEPRYQPGGAPGIGWVLSPTLDTIAPTGTGQSVGLRLKDPADTDFMVQRAVTVLGADRVAQVTKWQQARAEAAVTTGSSDRCSPCSVSVRCSRRRSPLPERSARGCGASFGTSPSSRPSASLPARWPAASSYSTWPSRCSG